MEFVMDHFFPHTFKLYKMSTNFPYSFKWKSFDLECANFVLLAKKIDVSETAINNIKMI